jgi:hypothetical protein
MIIKANIIVTFTFFNSLMGGCNQLTIPFFFPERQGGLVTAGRPERSQKPVSKEFIY